MKKHHIRPILLIIILLAWLLIPHYITGTAGYAALAALSILTILCFYKTRSWQSQRTVSAQAAIHLELLCLAASICLLIVYLPIILISVASGHDASKALSLIAVGIFAADWYVYTLISKTSTTLLKIETSIYISVACLCLCLIFLFLGQGKGLRPLLWLFAVAGCLAVCLMSYITYHVPKRETVYEVGWGGCIALAAVLTILLNLQFATEQKTTKTYLVQEEGRSGAVCILDDGHKFTYSGCPTPVGCTGRINQYDGWFHISFLAE